MELVCNYLEALRANCNMFRTLKGVEPCCDLRGVPIALASSNSVILKVSIGGEIRAMKCYFRPNPSVRQILSSPEITQSPLIVPHQLLQDELTIIDIHQNRPVVKDVVLTPWIGGFTLEQAARSAATTHQKERLEELAYRFDRFAIALLDAPFAHGDLKPDNIIVSDDREFQLIDLDNVWIEGTDLRPGRGTPNFNHPLRHTTYTGPHIDDYSIALLSTTLHAIAIEPKLVGSESIVAALPQAIIEGSDPTYSYITELFVAQHSEPLQQLAALLQSPSPEIESLREVLCMVVNSTPNVTHK